MDTDGNSGTWITGDYEEARYDFVTKSSMAQYTKYREPYAGDLPNPVKSRADIILTEIEKELEATESRYDDAKERLRYSKFLYQTAGSISLGTNNLNQIDEFPIAEINSQSDISSNSHVANEQSCENNNLASGDSRYLKEAKNTQNRTQDEIEPIGQSPAYTARSFKVTSGSNVFHDVHDENSNDLDTRNYFSERARGGKKNFLYEDSLENCPPDDTNHIREELLMLNDISSTRKQHPYQLNLAEYSKGLQDELEEESRNAESPTNEDREIYPSELKSSRQRESRKPELHLNLSESVESLSQTPMKSKKSRADKQRRVSSKIVSKQIDDTICATIKRKRKKRGLKTSNSKCTTATRDTCISENKKDIRKRKLKGHSTIPGLQLSQNRRHDFVTKIQNNMSEVVEIYHNNAVKSGSISVVSSKHSKLMEPRGRSFNVTGKLDQPSRVKGSYRLVESNDRDKRICNDIEERRSGKREKTNKSNESRENSENGDKMYRDDLQDPTDLRSEEPNITNYQAEFPAGQSENKIIEESKNHHRHRQNCQSPDNSSPYYDPLLMRNYELPTVASRLKQVNRSYFNRFNFTNIPFVVGTSVTPSYNLGLNIQETLSLMKTRQIMPVGVSPLLISNVTKGIRPVSTLLGCIRDEDETLPEELNIPYGVTSSGISNGYQGQLTGEKISRSVQLGPFPLKTPRLSCIHGAQTLYEAQQSCTNPRIELTSKKKKTRSICSSMKFNQRNNIDLQAELTQSTLLRQRREEINIGDSQSIKWQNVTHSTKGIRDVMMNFHDQYETMISKFEKLQEQAKKTSDKSLEKEIQFLEKELNAKEEEINAVAGLYQEVMLLKQQMRMLQERNSLVCVATESPGSPMYPHMSIRAQTATPIHTINFYRRGGSLNNQGPPTSTRLAGFLRQIKAFQKQLKSTT